MPRRLLITLLFSAIWGPTTLMAQPLLHCADFENGLLALDRAVQGLTRMPESRLPMQIAFAKLRSSERFEHASMGSSVDALRTFHGTRVTVADKARHRALVEQAVRQLDCSSDPDPHSVGEDHIARTVLSAIGALPGWAFLLLVPPMVGGAFYLINRSEGRSARRYDVSVPATLVDLQNEAACTVVNISRSGARLTSERSHRVGQAVTLLVGDARHAARCVWLGRGAIGVKFAIDLSRAELRAVRKGTTVTPS